MIRYAVIVVLLVVVGVLADRVAREENQRYALMLNACPEKRTDPSLQLLDFQCLDKVQTRTAWAWHLYYGLTEPLPQVPWTSQ